MAAGLRPAEAAPAPERRCAPAFGAAESTPASGRDRRATAAETCAAAGLREAAPDSADRPGSVRGPGGAAAPGWLP